MATVKGRVDDYGRECTKCGEYKHWDKFYPRDNGVNRKQSKCKDCSKSDSKAYHKQNSERLSRKALARYNKDPDKHKADNRAWYKANRKREIKRMRESYKATPKEYLQEYHRQKTYGINKATFQELLEDQQGLCAICGFEFDPNDTSRKTAQKINIDHCHSTGIIRGLLCSSCNQAIGRLKDDPELIRKAADYVQAEGVHRLRDLRTP